MYCPTFTSHLRKFLTATFLAIGSFVVACTLPHDTFAATFELIPATAEGSTFNVQVRLDTGGEKVWGYDVCLKYDTTKLSVESINFTELFPVRRNPPGGTNCNTYFTAYFDNPSPTSVYNGTGIVATLNLRGRQAGVVPLEFACTPNEISDSNIFRDDADDTDIIACDQLVDGSYTVVLTSTASTSTGATATPSPTGVASGSITPTRTPTPTPTGVLEYALTTTPTELPVTAFDKPTWTILLIGAIMVAAAGWVMYYQPEYRA